MPSQEPLLSVSAASSRFAHCTRWQAFVFLGLFLAATGWCVYVAATRPIMPPPSDHANSATSTGDAEFYRAVVNRVHNEENYYDAVAVELRARGYTPHSVFNWRPPLYAWLFGKPPSPVVAWILLGLLAVLTLVLTFKAVRAESGPGHAAAASVLLLGPLAWCCFADVALFSELWAGVLIALSVAALAMDQRRLGWLAALLAICFRELALPYYVLAAVWACWKCRRKVAYWLSGLVLYAGFMAFHTLEASARLGHGDVVQAGSWVQFGGTVFMLLTAQVTYYLIILPSAVTAVYLPLALLGLIGSRSRVALLASWTAGTFVVMFTIIGMWPQNAYWGLLYAPVLSLGVVWAPVALRDLWAAVRAPESSNQARGAARAAMSQPVLRAACFGQRESSCHRLPTTTVNPTPSDRNG